MLIPMARRRGLARFVTRPSRKRALLMFAVAIVTAVAFFTIACGSRDSATEEKLSALQTQVAPKPEIVSTPDARAPAAATAYAALTSVTTAALEVFSSLLILDFDNYDATKHQSSWAELQTACATFRSPFAAFDIWPPPWRDFASAAQSACSYLDNYGKHPTPASWSSTVFLLREVALPKLRAAETGIPDYSQAQIKRAIQERQ